MPPGSAPLVKLHIKAELHMVVAHGAARIRLCLCEVPVRLVPTFVIPCDAGASLRLAAAAHYERTGRSRRRVAPRLALPSHFQRSRYVQFLRLQDGLDAGASARDLAYGLIFPNHLPLAGPTWKGSGERRHVQRMIASARRLVNGGYRRLLMHS